MNTTPGNEGERHQGNPEGNAADLEREGNELRAGLDQTLDALGRKLAPGEVMDRTVAFVQQNGGAFIHQVSTAVRQNPAPWLLTAAGMVWVAASLMNRQGSGSSSAMPDYSGAGNRAGASTRSGTGIGSKVDAAREKLADSATALKSRAGRAQGQLSHFVQEQPLTVGALALAAGAILGAALPMTDYENRTVGPVHDRALAKAADVGRAQYEKVRDKLSAAAESSGESDDSGESQPRNGGSMGRAAGSDAGAWEPARPV